MRDLINVQVEDLDIMIVRINEIINLNSPLNKCDITSLVNLIYLLTIVIKLPVIIPELKH
jgi:hypothetical protein